MSQRPARAARWRLGLLAFAAACASGNSAFARGPSADARDYLNAHNAVRAAVQRPADYPGPWAPLPPVAWSDEVASDA